MSQLLGGRYQFIKVLGADTLEQTYLVGDTHFPGHPKCVVKHLQLPNKNPRTLKFVIILLKKKAESLKKLAKHDQIPQILDYFDESNNFYLVEEFIPGRAISKEFVANHAVSEVQIVNLLQDTLEILERVHGWGIIHRSINPHNLIRRQTDGKLILTGFGIFKEIGTQVMRSPQNSQVSTQGASAYMPNEQFQGQLQFNTDLYALGVIAIRGLTGIAETELERYLSATSDLSWHDLARANPKLLHILDKMVHLEGNHRYQHASEVLHDLRHLAGPSVLPKENVPVEQPTAAAAPPASPPRPHPQTPRWLVPSLAGLLIFAVLTGLVYQQVPQRWVANYLLNQGNDLQNQGNHHQAIASFSQAIQIAPTSSAYFTRGSTYYQAGQYRDALDDLTQAIRLNPNLSDAYYLRGNIRYQLSDRQGAIADYTEVLQRDPKAANALVNRGSVRADLGDDQGAIEDYTQALQINPNLAAAYLNRCLSRSNLDNHQGAIADCTQAINLEPNSVLAYQNRGLVRRRLGNLTGAIEDLNIAIRLDPDDADPYYNRGLARMELGDNQGAITDYSKAIEKNPDHVFAHYDRGIARLELQDRLGAIADFQKSATLCLNSGRSGCYEDAQFQLKQLTDAPSATAQP